MQVYLLPAKNLATKMVNLASRKTFQSHLYKNVFIQAHVYQLLIINL